MDDEFEYSISDHAEENTVQCLECGVNIAQSQMGRHTVTCDKLKKEYEKRLREKAEAKYLERMLEKLL